MNRHSRIGVRLGSDALAAIRVDGEFQAGETEAFAEGVAAVHGLKVTRTGDELVLTRH